MKKFSSFSEEIKPKYELKDSLRNEINTILEDTLSIKISNEELLDKDININGKEELVEKLKNFIDEVRIKERTLTLETVKANVHRNFDMNWLNEQIDTLKKKTRGSLILTENINDNVKVDNKNVLNYFVKKLHEIKKIGEFEFEFEPLDGIFKFVNENDGIVVKATPFYNDESGLPIEVFSKDQEEYHIFIEQREFSVEKILFEKYINLMEEFLVDQFDRWIGKVEKSVDNEEKDTYSEGEKYLNFRAKLINQFPR